MANIGEKRPAPDSTSGSEEGAKSKEAEEESGPTAPKRPAPSFNFRPSPLQQATQGFSLKSSSLGTSETPREGASSKTSTIQAGFLKLDSNDLKPISVNPLSLGAPSVSSAFRGVAQEPNSGSVGQFNHNAAEQPNNLFLQFLARTSSANSFSSVSSSNSAASAMSTHPAEGTPTNAASANEQGPPRQGEDRPPEAAVGLTTQGDLHANGEDFSGGGARADPGGLPFGFQGATAIFPEIQTVTGEEKEKKIIQVPVRLYAFDVDTHTWKERGRGEVRLNDAAQSGGLFQSRLVMRASGSYRVLLNTHLWAQMKCERANQKSVRITAQHGDQGEVAVFLIMGATKDIQQLFTAIDRRIEALRRNANTDLERDGPSTTKSAVQVPFDDDDKESFVDEPHSSPDSSPDRQIGSRTRLVPTIKTVAVPSEGEASKVEVRGEGGAKEEGVGPEGEGKGADLAEGNDDMKNSGSDGGEDIGSDRESTSATPPSSRSPSVAASTTTISSSDNPPESNFSQ